MRDFQAAGRAGGTMRQVGESGALLVTGADKPNVMTVSWSLAGVIWHKNIWMAPVRKSRYSHELLDAHKEFTIFVPKGDMRRQIGICGTRSGRDTDKIALCGFALAPSKTVSVPHIAEAGLVMECRVLYETDMDGALLHPSVLEDYYSSGEEAGNMHTLYFGEITAQYEIG